MAASSPTKTSSRDILNALLSQREKIEGSTAKDEKVMLMGMKGPGMEEAFFFVNVTDLELYYPVPYDVFSRDVLRTWRGCDRRVAIPFLVSDFGEGVSEIGIIGLPWGPEDASFCELCGATEHSTEDCPPMPITGNCWGCRVAPGTKVCVRCQKARYCGRECQRSDWKRHSATCNKKQTEILGHLFRQLVAQTPGRVVPVPAPDQEAEETSEYTEALADQIQAVHEKRPAVQAFLTGKDRAAWLYAKGAVVEGGALRNSGEGELAVWDGLADLLQDKDSDLPAPYKEKKALEMLLSHEKKGGRTLIVETEGIILNSERTQRFASETGKVSSSEPFHLLSTFLY